VTLDELIEMLEAEDPNRIVPLGFRNPHSYRGCYGDVAFEPTTAVPIGEMLTAARSAVGSSYGGWKGGSYTMTAYTCCWLAMEGDASDENIGPTLLRLMLTAVSPEVYP